MTHTPVYWCKSTGTGYWYQKTGQCVWPLTLVSSLVLTPVSSPVLTCSAWLHYRYTGRAAGLWRIRRHGHDLFSYSAVYRLCSLSFFSSEPMLFVSLMLFCRPTVSGRVPGVVTHDQHWLLSWHYFVYQHVGPCVSMLSANIVGWCQLSVLLVRWQLLVTNMTADIVGRW